MLETLIPAEEMNLINVNLPRAPRGLIWTRVAVQNYDGVIVPTKDPIGRELYWFTVRPLEGADEGTDRWAIEQRWISMTPLCLDLYGSSPARHLPRAAAARRRTGRALVAAEVVARSGQEGRAGRSVRGDRAGAVQGRPDCTLGACMALTATIYNFDIDLADSDRGVYETIALRVAQHPSESDEYLIGRVLAYLLEYTEGIEFSRGVSDPDEPMICDSRPDRHGSRAGSTSARRTARACTRRRRRRSAWWCIATRIPASG